MSVLNRSADILGDGPSGQQSAASLFKVIGGWGNITGPSLFMLRSIIVGSTSAVFFGLTGGVAGGILFGTASLPFIAAASFGFVFGTCRWYIASVKQALLDIDRFPSLLRLHLDLNYASEMFRRRPLDYFRTPEFKHSWRMQSMLVVAWLTAQNAIDEIHSNQEQVLIVEAAENASVSKEWYEPESEPASLQE